jgi:hypothetical protein
MSRCVQTFDWNCIQYILCMLKVTMPYMWSTSIITTAQQLQQSALLSSPRSLMPLTTLIHLVSDHSHTTLKPREHVT